MLRRCPIWRSTRGRVGTAAFSSTMTPEPAEISLDRARFAAASAAEVGLLRFRDGQPLLTLPEALEIFRMGTNPGQRLCLDIKDYGFEERHVDHVRAAGLEDRVYYISWIPQVLLRLAELKVRSPLFLSHANLLCWGRPAGILEAALGDRILRLSQYVVIGKNRATSGLGALGQGYQHMLVCRELPGLLLDVLLASRGGICVHRLLGRRRLREYCSRHGLRLWLFSVRTFEQFRRDAAGPEVDVVFCDDAPSILKRLGRETVGRPPWPAGAQAASRREMSRGSAVWLSRRPRRSLPHGYRG